MSTTNNELFPMKKLLLSLVLLLSAFPVSQAQDIFEALRKGDIEAVRVLVEKAPTLLDSRDGDGMTPLHHAARDGNAVLVHYLINKGAKIEIQNNQGKTPLHLAATFDRKDAVAALVKYFSSLLYELQLKPVRRMPIH